ncbi:uncharacterized protein LOC127276905 [Leptopilina boulardi]|uniref:uncharacterized protein LOC127276905 n=1 Tax=Leptopilina boulardi TaxID=63433 RepID=UPI0021F54BB9|nr:uncharacterized protein LOC127276905 [Leptopilina boulardi]
MKKFEGLLGISHRRIRQKVQQGVAAQMFKTFSHKGASCTDEYSNIQDILNSIDEIDPMPMDLNENVRMDTCINDTAAVPVNYQEEISTKTAEPINSESDCSTDYDDSIDDIEISDEEINDESFPYFEIKSEHELPFRNISADDNLFFNDNLEDAEYVRDKKSEKFNTSITLWALAFGIPHIALTALLIILRTHTDLIIPRDSRSLLHTPRNVDIINMDGDGKYCHFGSTKIVEKIANEYLKRNLKNREIRLIFNIDGLPIYKSSQKSLWLILCSDELLKKVFVVGIFAGTSKPADSNEFLKPFVDEAAQLCGSSITVKEQ